MLIFTLPQLEDIINTWALQAYPRLAMPLCKSNVRGMRKGPIDNNYLVFFVNINKPSYHLHIFTRIFIRIFLKYVAIIIRIIMIDFSQTIQQVCNVCLNTIV